MVGLHVGFKSGINHHCVLREEKNPQIKIMNGEGRRDGEKEGKMEKRMEKEEDVEEN